MDFAPVVSRVTRPSRRDQQSLTSRLSSMTPETLSGILANAERGQITDWADTCDRMVQIDGHVRANYETRLAAVGGARWEVLPGWSGVPARDALSGAGRDFIEAVLSNCTSFDQCVMDLCDAVGTGLAVQEIDWSWEADAWIPANLRWVHQRRFRWGLQWDLRLIDAGAGQLTGGYGTPVHETWPRKFLVHTPRARAGYPGVTGCLRPVAWDFLFKRWAKQFWVTGAERFAWPLMYGQVARGTTKEVRDAVQAALQQLSSDHTAVVEGETALKILETTAKDGGVWKDLVAALNSDISKSILGSTDQTEPSEIGAWKAVESRKGTTVDSRTALDERQLAAMMRGSLVTWILEFNAHRFGGVVPAIPSVRWVIADKRREIPEELLKRRIVRRNEARQSIGMDPLEGAEGEEWIGDEGAAGAAVATAEGAPVAADVQQQAFNGAQIASLVDVIAKVSSGEIPVESAREIILISFPTVSPADADKLLAPMRAKVPAAPVPAPASDEAA